jgi:hypothetical protein
MAVPFMARVAVTSVSFLTFASSQTLQGCDTTGGPATGAKPASTHATHKATHATHKADSKAPAGGTVYYRTVSGKQVCAVLDAPGQDGTKGCTDTSTTVAQNCFVGSMWPVCGDRRDYQAPKNK